MTSEELPAALVDGYVTVNLAVEYWRLIVMDLFDFNDDGMLTPDEEFMAYRMFEDSTREERDDFADDPWNDDLEDDGDLWEDGELDEDDLDEDEDEYDGDDFDDDIWNEHDENDGIWNEHDEEDEYLEEDGHDEFGDDFDRY